MSNEQVDLKAFRDGMGSHFAAECSGKKTETVQVYTGKCLLAAGLLYTNGTNDASLILYDGTTNAGKIILEVYAKGTDGQGPFGAVERKVRCQTGIYGVLTGTGAYFLVDYVARV
jgi:hypothetical protein